MISLIVLTYRPGGIDILAESLQKTIPGRDPWELVLVDDYPNRVGKGTVQAYLKAMGIPLGWYGGSKNKAYPETKGGLCNATNTGIIHSKGDYLVFLSDYTILQPMWLLQWENFRRNYSDTMVCGSAIMFDAPKPDNLGDVTTWKGMPVLYPKWPWVPEEWETFFYATKTEYWLLLNGLDERADHCHCWPVSSHLSQARQAGIPLLKDPNMCTKAGSLVRTKDGMKPIEKVEVGELVLTHLGRWKKVTDILIRYASREQMVKFGGPCIPFSLTANHPVWMQKRRLVYQRRDEFGKWEWLRADCLRRDDHISMPMPRVNSGAWKSLDLADYVDRSTSDKVHAVIAAKKSGATYKQMASTFEISWMQARKWSNQKSIPKAAVFIEEENIRLAKLGHRIKRHIPIGFDFGRFFGYMVSDGWANKTQLGVCFGIDQEAYADDFSKLLIDLFNLSSMKREYPEKKMWRVNSSCCCLSRIMKKLMNSEGNARKWIPHRFLQEGSVDFLRGLVIGLWRGDGCVIHNPHIQASYVTVSVPLAFQVQEVLFRLGITSRVKRNKSYESEIRGRKIKNSGCFTVSLSGSSARKLCDILGERYLQIAGNGSRRYDKSFVEKHQIVNRVKVSRETYTGFVYNLEVEDDHSYTINGVAVHNCAWMIDHRIWDEAMTEPSPWGPSCGMWRIDHRTSLLEEPQWVVPSPNPFNLREMREKTNERNYP